MSDLEDCLEDVFSKQLDKENKENQVERHPRTPRVLSLLPRRGPAPGAFFLLYFAARLSRCCRTALTFAAALSRCPAPAPRARPICR